MTLPEGVRLCDVVSSLMKRGREEEATELYIHYTLYLNFIHDIPPEDALEMTINELIEWRMLPPKPMNYTGWNHIWGPAAFKNLREESYNA